ncbi:MAG TPA: hypothetical protein VGL94_03880 [Ktedonobacteraceae bacterium]|jgi:hypothetical protein
MEPFCKTWRWLGNDPHQLIGVRILQIAIGAKLLFDVFTELPFATFLWGPNGVGWGSTKPVLGPMLGNIFDLFFTTDTRIFYVLSVLIIGALWLLIGYNTRFATFITLISFFIIHQRLPEITDAGDTLTILVLIYMLFLLPHRAKFSSGQFRVWLHNIGVLAIIFQLVVVYFTSGLAKADGDWWQQGVAMYYISQVQWFMLPSSHTLFINPWIVTIATYGPMVYQLLFPIAIISRVKLPWILLGILLHVGIAVFMAMVSFSTVMIGLELFLISDQEYVQIWKRGHLILGKLVRIPNASTSAVSKIPDL